MKIFILLSLLVLHLFGEVSISEAWHKLKSSDNSLAASTDDVSRAELKKESASSMYLPSISITGSYTHLDKPIGVDISSYSGSINQILGALGSSTSVPSSLDFSEQDIFLADLQLLWPLYSGGKIDAAQDIYAAKVSEAEALHHMKEDKSFLNLVKIYYGVVMSRSLYNTRVEVQNALSIHYEHAQKLKAQGQIAKIELLNAQVKLDSAKIETTKAEHKLSIVSSSLANMIKDREKPSSYLFINSDAKTREHYEEQTLQNFAALKVLDAKSKQTLSLVDIKESAWYPSVVAYGNYNLYKDDSPFMSMAPEWMAGVMVKIDLLQRADRNQEVQAAALLHSKVNNLKAQAKEDLKLLVEKTYNEMLLYRDEYTSLNSSLDLANENYRLREVAFAEGLATSVEVVDAQMFLASVKTKRLNAGYNYVQKISQLSVLSGDSELFFEIQNISQEIK